MRKISSSLSILACFVLTPIASAEISFLLTADTLKDASDVAVDSVTGSWMLVASTADADFGEIGAGGISVGDFVGGDDLIIAKGDFVNLLDGAIQSGVTGLSLGGQWTVGDPIELVWFPEVSSSATSIDAGAAYGWYTDSVGIDESAPWETPADPTSNYVLNLLTSGNSGFFGTGSVPNAAVQADQLTVPEPSVSLLGLLSLGLLLRRRR